ncbi:MAG: hypothetical protein ACK5MU_05050 [Candidatus Saccharimonadales bacterium]
MSDITINNEENQDNNQKTNPVTESLIELHDSSSSSLGGILQIWLPSTKNLEPISSVLAAEPCRLSPNACAGKPALAPPEKPFALFFEFPPAEISF